MSASIGLFGISWDRRRKKRGGHGAPHRHQCRLLLQAEAVAEYWPLVSSSPAPQPAKSWSSEENGASGTLDSQSTGLRQSKRFSESTSFTATFTIYSKRLTAKSSASSIYRCPLCSTVLHLKKQDASLFRVFADCKHGCCFNNLGTASAFHTLEALLRLSHYAGLLIEMVVCARE